MDIKEKEQKIAIKRIAFEYFVVCLQKWKQEMTNDNIVFTKLQLHKLLFLASTIGATMERHEMLDIFNMFYALRYGPVEMDVYDSMQSNQFLHLQFNGNECKLLDSINDLSVEDEIKLIIENAILLLKERNEKYVTMSPYQLVDITHGWTVWQISMAVAELCGNKKELMRSEDIILSTIKSF